MADRVKPSDPEPNEYAGFRAPQRPDASTIAGGQSGAGGYYSNPGGERGNQVDPRRINKTSKQFSSQPSRTAPAGPPTGFGY